MKYCSNCGQTCEDTEKFCNNCGMPLPQEPAEPDRAIPDDETVRTETPAPMAATKKEFLKLPEYKRMGGEINAAAIICYVLAGINLGAGFFMDTFPANLIDVAVLAGLGLGIHLAKSRVCAILLLVYAVAGVIISLVGTGKPSGYLIVFVGVMAVIYTFKAEKAWQQYRKNDTL